MYSEIKVEIISHSFLNGNFAIYNLSTGTFIYLVMICLANREFLYESACRRLFVHRLLLNGMKQL
uniref:DN26767_c0_g1_i1 n=1 Tax=Ceratitis capitata TaxID=7213 RepID=A0A6B7K9X5_CERCA|nr:DN26767_c0_g1_i1 [Ceratitis capitata]